LVDVIQNVRINYLVERDTGVSISQSFTHLKLTSYSQANS